MPSPASQAPCLRPVWGHLGGFVSQAAQRLFQTNIQGFLSCWVGRWQLPALPRILLQTKHLGFGDSCNCQLPGASQVLGLTLQRGLVPSGHLPGFSQGCSRAPHRRSPHLSPATPHPTPWSSRPREAGRPFTTARSTLAHLSRPALLTLLPSLPQGGQPPSPQGRVPGWEKRVPGKM